MRGLPRRGSPDYLPMLGAIAVLGLALLFTAGLVVSGARGLLGDNGDGDLALSAPTPLPTAPATIPAPAPTATVAAPAPGPAPWTVCLDVGHGGIDLGKVAVDGNGEEVYEKDLVLKQALDIRDRLQSRGIRVVLNRERDTEVNPWPENADVNRDGETATDVNGNGVFEPGDGDAPSNIDEFQARVNACNVAGADVLVSVHINGSENPEKRGYEAWWADGRPDSERSAWLADRLTTALGTQFAAAGFETPFMGAFDDSRLDQGVTPPPGALRNLAILSPDVPERPFVGSTMPGVVAESLYLSNPEDAAFLTSPEGHEAIVAAYVEAIVAYAEEFPEPVANDPAATPGTIASGDVTLAAGGAPAPPPPNPNATPRPAPPPDPGIGSSLIVDRGESGRREIALTFDAGADRGYASEILDLLKERGVAASFGLTGTWAEMNSDLVRRMVAEGHQLFNHTYSHRSATGASTGGEPETSWETVNELTRTDQIVTEVTGGYDMKPYFRPPYGDYDNFSLRDYYAAGYYLTIWWTVDSFGWKAWTPAEIAQHCITGAEPGGILLFHVGSGGGDYEALPEIIDALAKDGYSFVTLEQLFQP